MIRGRGMGQPIYLSLGYGQQKLKCLLDSGCERSVMPRWMVERETVGAADQVLFAVDGARLDTRGVVRISLELDGMVLPVEAMVSEHVREPMLGRDFLVKNGCVLNFQDSTVMVQGRKFPLEVGENDNHVRVRRLGSSRRVGVSEESQTDEQEVLTPVEDITQGVGRVMMEGGELRVRQTREPTHPICWVVAALLWVAIVMVVLQGMATVNIGGVLGGVDPVMVMEIEAGMVVDTMAPVGTSREGETTRRHHPSLDPSANHVFPSPSRSNPATPSTIPPIPHFFSSPMVKPLPLPSRVSQPE